MPRLEKKPVKGRAGTRSGTQYRAVTRGGHDQEWAVVDSQGSVVYLGDARVAAMIASRLTRPQR